MKELAFSKHSSTGELLLGRFFIFVRPTEELMVKRDILDLKSMFSFWAV